MLPATCGPKEACPRSAKGVNRHEYLRPTQARKRCQHLDRLWSPTPQCREHLFLSGQLPVALLRRHAHGDLHEHRGEQLPCQSDIADIQLKTRPWMVEGA